MKLKQNSSLGAAEGAHLRACDFADETEHNLKKLELQFSTVVQSRNSAIAGLRTLSFFKRLKRKVLGAPPTAV